MAETVVVDASPTPKLPYDPKDIPEAVKRRVAAVEALYKPAVPESSQETPTPPVEPQSEQLALDLGEVPAAQVSSSTPIVPTSTPATPEEENNDSWKRKFLRMQGQFNASQKTIGEMQEQMNQLGNELIYAQRAAQQTHNAPPTPQQAPHYLTERDFQDYGPDLIGLSKRAAAETVAPHLHALEQQTREMQYRLAQQERARMDQRVESEVPNFRMIDQDPRWLNWLKGIDVLSGRVRQTLLDEAIAAADAPRAASFFKGFLREEAATGHTELEPGLSQASPPRDAAMDLASLAAPGRARPATGGESSLPLDRPVYTRAQIAQLYRAHQKGAYLGRDAEWMRQEADIIAAGREGRIRT